MTELEQAQQHELIEAQDKLWDLRRPEVGLDVSHFGNAPLEYPQRVCETLKRAAKTMQVWTRSHSNFTWRTQTIGGEYSLTRQLRQVAAQLRNRRMAMVENKHKYQLSRQRARVLREQAENTAESEVERKKYLLLQAAEQEEKADLVYEPYVGACKDVEELGALHDNLVEQIKAKHGGRFDEEVFELEESEYWVRRAFSQSLRDIRQSGTITKGEQELLEQIGLNPSAVQNMLREWLSGPEIQNTVNIAVQEKFLEDCVTAYKQASHDVMLRKGLPTEALRETLLIDEPKEM